MKLIEITEACAGINFSFIIGEEVEVSNDLASDLINAGYAKEIERSKPIAEPLKSDEPNEEVEIKQAVVTDSKKRKRK